MRLDAVSEHLTRQDGVVTRGQLLAAKVTQAQVDTLLRRRELVVVHPGVYLTHTGASTWSQRSWAAVLYAGRSALHLESALHRPDKDAAPSGPVDVAVDWSRRVAPQPDLRIHRVRGLEGKVRWNLSPPRVRVEVAAVEVAHRAPDDLAAISALASVVGSRRTVADRLRAEMERRGRLRRRGLLTELAADLEEGTHSVLEHGYLVRVVRPHGLPRAHLPTSSGGGGGRHRVPRCRAGRPGHVRRARRTAARRGGGTGRGRRSRPRRPRAGPGHTPPPLSAGVRDSLSDGGEAG